MKNIIAALLLVALSAGAQAQSHDPIALMLDGDTITAAELKAEFEKSAARDLTAATPAAKRKELSDYADLYLNFRLKLRDAYAQGLDTTPTLLKELAGYRAELAAPYLIDSATMSRMLREAYERNHYALQCHHIIIHVDRDAKPEDTLAAYERIMRVYERVTTGGEDFDAVAREIYREEALRTYMDPKVAKREEPYAGQLPAFTVFDMVYPFENAAYAMKEGETSKPVRSRFGYHVIRLLHRSPYYGTASLQHIWVSSNGIGADKARKKIEEAYDRLQQGDNFSLVASRYSDDKTSANSGGLMPSLPLRQMPPEYVPEVAKLQAGEYSKPFQSQYGWHIVYVASKESIPPFESMVEVYKQRLASQPERAHEASAAFGREMLLKYDVEDYTQEYDGTGRDRVVKADLREATSFFNDTVFRLQWHYVPMKERDERPIFRIQERQYTNHDLLRYIEAHQRIMLHCDPVAFTKGMFESFKEQMAIDYADAHLEQDHPEFAALVNEYREGLMIFAYNEKNVWRKAIIDTVGFERYYAQESAAKRYGAPGDTNYFWNTRAEVTTVHVSDSTCLPRHKAMKVMRKGIKKQMGEGVLLDALQAKLAKQCNAEKPVQVTQAMVERGSQDLLHDNEWEPGIYGRNTLTGYRLLQVTRIIPPTLKDIREARGYYLNDYQNHLERQLVERLKARYHAVRHQDVINAIAL